MLSGRIPLDSRLTQCLEGNSYVGSFTGAPAQTALAGIVVKIIEELEGDKGQYKQNTMILVLYSRLINCLC